jgi:hypothetical protein
VTQPGEEAVRDEVVEDSERKDSAEYDQREASKAGSLGSQSRPEAAPNDDPHRRHRDGLASPGEE